MTINFFYLMTGVLLAAGGALVWDTSPFTDTGGPAYERKRTRRAVGSVVLISSALSLVIAVMS